MIRRLVVGLMVVSGVVACGSTSARLSPSTSPMPAAGLPSPSSSPTATKPRPAVLFPRRYSDPSLSSHRLTLIHAAVVPAGARSASVTVTSPRHGTIDVVVDCGTGVVSTDVDGAVLTPRCAGQRLDVLTRPASGQQVVVQATVTHRQPRRWGVAIYRTR